MGFVMGWPRGGDHVSSQHHLFSPGKGISGLCFLVKRPSEEKVLLVSVEWRDGFRILMILMPGACEDTFTFWSWSICECKGLCACPVRSKRGEHAAGKWCQVGQRSRPCRQLRALSVKWGRAGSSGTRLCLGWMACLCVAGSMVKGAAFWPKETRVG